MAPQDPEVWNTASSLGAIQPGRPFAWLSRTRASLATLKTRLTLAAIGSLIVGIGSISLLSQHRVERDLLRQTQEREVAHTARLAEDLSQRVVSLQQALRLTADQIDPALEQLDDALEQHLQAQPALLQEFANLFVAAPDGKLRLVIDDAGPRRPRVSIADREYFKQLMSEKRPIISEAVPGRISGEPVVVFAHPIVRDGKVTSVLGGAIRLSSRNLAAFLLDRVDASAATELLAITDDRGQLLAHPVRDLLLKPVTADSHLLEAFADWKSRGAPVEPSGLLLHQPGAVATAAGVAGTTWVVWRSLPEAALLGPVRASRHETLRDTAFAIVVLGIITFLLVRSQLRPLIHLQQRARNLFDAKQDVHEGWPTQGGEIGSVVQALRHVGAERAHLEAFTGQLLGKLHSVLAAAPVGIAFTRDQRFELVSQAWCRLLLTDEADLLGTRTAAVFADETDYEALGPLVGKAFADGGEYAGEWQFRRRDGSLFWGHLCGRPVDINKPDAGTIWTLADITDSRATREDLQWSATHDVLTGLANRGAFEARLRAVFGHPPASLLFIDLDRFKPINDTHGHAAGDAMLKEVASALQAHVRIGDLVVRLGGDEFAVVLERCPPDAAHRVAMNVQRAITRAQLSWQGQNLQVGASVGIAPLTDRLAGVDEWVAAADAACYAAKSAGRGTVRTSIAAAANVVPLVRDQVRRETP